MIPRKAAVILYSISPSLLVASDIHIVIAWHILSESIFASSAVTPTKIVSILLCVHMAKLVVVVFYYFEVLRNTSIAARNIHISLIEHSKLITDTVSCTYLAYTLDNSLISCTSVRKLFIDIAISNIDTCSSPSDCTSLFQELPEDPLTDSLASTIVIVTLVSNHRLHVHHVVLQCTCNLVRNAKALCVSAVHDVSNTRNVSEVEVVHITCI